MVRVDGVLSNADEKQKQKSDFDLCFADGSQSHGAPLHNFVLA